MTVRSLLRGRPAVTAAAVAVVAGGVAAGLIASPDGSGGGAGEAESGPAAAAGLGALGGLDRPGKLLFRNAVPSGAAGSEQAGRLAAVPLAAPGGARTVSGLSCVRVHSRGGTGVCLTVERSAHPQAYAIALDGRLGTTHKIPIPGTPSRAQVSPSGRMISWTVFVSGDSYAGENLSTRTGVLDTRTGQVIPDLERFTLLQDGRPNTNVDLNYWGVTFTRDDDRFYATAKTKGTTYLVQGRVSTQAMWTMRTNVECPSLSPDGTRLAFKKATGDPARPWRLHVLELRGMRETALAERESVDDQVVWMDDRTVAYGRLRGSSTEVRTVPADGSGAPRTLLADAFSPAPIP
ncbi:PD40 domain-containing protein [Actinomadura vinacea]|uniref:PD40 domain-containing protein n=1 Tax=Actinomadura vinacea TaxID=115336 RepID=A0ABN3IZ71_9ACTN